MNTRNSNSKNNLLLSSGSTIRVKICGIRNQQDLNKALFCGADAVGFISGATHFSEDCLSVQQARRLALMTPPYINRVLVTHLQQAEQVLNLAESIQVDSIQIHGLVNDHQAKEITDNWTGTVARVYHIGQTTNIDRLLEITETCNVIHLDTRTEDRLGGTGKTHDWKISREVVIRLTEYSFPVILAGGLNPSNIQQAIGTVQPYAVDVNSGVDDPCGNKDFNKLKQFISLAKSANKKPE